MFLPQDKAEWFVHESSQFFYKWVTAPFFLNSQMWIIKQFTNHSNHFLSIFMSCRQLRRAEISHPESCFCARSCFWETLQDSSGLTWDSIQGNEGKGGMLVAPTHHKVPVFSQQSILKLLQNPHCLLKKFLVQIFWSAWFTDALVSERILHSQPRNFLPNPLLHPSIPVYKIYLLLENSLSPHFWICTLCMQNPKLPPKLLIFHWRVIRRFY